MWKILQKLRRDESGNASVIALLLITTIVAIGAIAGLSTFRNQIVQEFGDIGVALDNLDHSFSYSIGIDTTGNGAFDTTITCSHVDDGVTLTDDIAGDAPAGLDFTIAPASE